MPILTLNDDEIRHLYIDERWTQGQIAEKLQVTQATVSRHIHKLGLTRNPIKRSHVPWSNKVLGVGEVFNDREIIEQVLTTDTGHRYYRVRCVKCESERVTTRSNILRSGCICQSQDSTCQKRLEEAARRFPIGTQFNGWEVISKPFWIKDRWQGMSWVDCKCSCGTIRKVRTTALASGTSTSCGIQRFHQTAEARENRANAIRKVAMSTYKGADHPRQPSYFKQMFPQDRCGWIRCPDPTASASKWGVDHNHNCPYHDSTHNACRHCVRAYVHHSCNLAVEHWDWAQKEGLPIPDDVAAYLSKGLN